MTDDREARHRRSLRRLGFDLKDGERRGRFNITREGAKVSEGGDLFGLDLAGAIHFHPPRPRPLQARPERLHVAG